MSASFICLFVLLPLFAAAESPCVRTASNYRLKGISPRSRSPADTIDDCMVQCAEQPLCKAAEYFFSTNIEKRACQLYDTNSLTNPSVVLVKDRPRHRGDVVTVVELLDACQEDANDRVQPLVEELVEKPVHADDELLRLRDGPLAADGPAYGAGPWTEWGPCIGYGYLKTQTRTRKCTAYSCGPKSETRPCQTAKWSDWGPYSPCTTSCGPGEQTRTRKCEGGPSCEGEGSQTQPCTGYKPCPVWTDWTPYSPCTTTCGPGEQTRTRTCQYGGPCEGESSQTQPCTGYKPCPVWTDWTPYSPCTTTCGPGEQTRTRTCQYGGPCVGEGSQTQPCAGYKPCCEWGPWGYWGSCSATCGKGEMTRTRKCKGCYSCPDGNPIESQPCNNLPPCGGGYYRPPPPPGYKGGR